MTDTNDIYIKLTKTEAIVLFEFLARFNKLHEDDSDEIFEDQSEQKMLWLIEGQLEKILVEPFMSNYGNLLKEARNKLRDERT